MYHFFVEPGQIGAEEITITGSDVNHIKNVLRMKPGEEIGVSNGSDREYHCRIRSLEPEQITAEILSEKQTGAELPADLYLFQGLPKGDKMELVIQKAVELGAAGIIPVASRRAVVKLDGKKEEAKLRRWNLIAESAAKQSGRTVIPPVKGVMSFREALDAAGELDLILFPYECAEGMEKTRQAFDSVKPGMKVGIFIGPEGGFDQGEAELAAERGAAVVTLGKRILRTETAGMAVLSILMYQLSQYEE